MDPHPPKPSNDNIIDCAKYKKPSYALLKYAKLWSRSGLRPPKPYPVVYKKLLHKKALLRFAEIRKATEGEGGAGGTRTY